MKLWDSKPSAGFRMLSLYIFICIGPFLGAVVLKYQDTAPGTLWKTIHLPDLLTPELIYVYWLGSIPTVITWIVFLSLCYALAPLLTPTLNPLLRPLFVPVIGILGAAAGILGGGLLMAAYTTDGYIAGTWSGKIIHGHAISAWIAWLFYSAWSPSIVAGFICAAISSIFMPVIGDRKSNLGQ